jgi:hypothetical protein
VSHDPHVPPEGPIKPRWTSASFVLYFGAFIVLFALVALFAVLAEEHGDAVFVLLSAVVLVAAGGLAWFFQAQERRITAGLFATITAVVFGVFFGALLELIGLLDFDDDGFDIGRLLVEVAVLAFTLFLLGRFRFPLLVLVAAATGWTLVADTLTDGGDWLAVLSILVGLVYMAIGVAVSRPYGMWLHLAAGLLIGGGLINFWAESDLDWVLVLLTGLVYIALANAFDRSSWAVLGALGIFASATHFIEEWFDLPDPLGFVFGGDAGDLSGTGRPLAYVVLGLGFVAVGLVLEARRRIDAPLEPPPSP